MQFDHIARQVPDIAAAVDWYVATIPGTEVLYQDPTWALVEAGGARLAFVTASQHPDHLAWRVTNAELERLAVELDASVALHRDATRSFYITGPGDTVIEIIAYPNDERP
jgi:catechol 2,3-dioxygenase-like lactoylglutathione lyase family enzyme